jgi:hypothetical protein
MLAWVGVSSELQGCGVGSALANEVVRLIDARPAPGWFVTFGRKSAHSTSAAASWSSAGRVLPESSPSWVGGHGVMSRDFRWQSQAVTSPLAFKTA